MLALQFLDTDFAAPRQMVFVPLAGCMVQAGFSSPADDHIEGRVSLDAAFIQRPTFTFIVKAWGTSMLGEPADIRPGDYLVVDKSLEAQVGDVVVARIQGKFTVKRLLRRKGRLVLAPDNEEHPQIVLTEETEALVWGVVVGRYTRYTRR